MAGALTLLLVLASVQLTTDSVAVAATFGTETPSGPAGSLVLVTGDDYLPLVSVGMCWDEAGCSDLGSAQPEGLLGAEFTAEIVIPADAEAGEHTIHACQLVGSGLTCSAAVFEVVGTEAPTTTTSLAPETSSSLPQTTVETTPVREEVDETAGASEEPVVDEEAVEVVATDPAPAAPVTQQEITTTSTTQPATEPELYTPPSITPTEPEPDFVQQPPTVVVEASGEVTSPFAYLGNPVVFWAAWLVVVIVTGAVAVTITWLVRRQRSAG